MSRRVLFFFLAWICYCGRALECSPLVYLEHSHRLRTQVLGDSPEDLAQVRFAFRNNASVLPFSAPRYLSSVSKYVAQLELSPSDVCEWLECSSDSYTLALTGSYGVHEALECNITREVRVPRYEFELYWVGDAWDNLNQSCRVQVLLESTLYDRYTRARVPLDSGLSNMRERSDAFVEQQQQHWVLSLNVSDSSHSIALEFRERTSGLAFARNLSLSTLHRTCSQKQGEESFSPGFRVECDIYEDHASLARRSRNVFVDGEYIYTACRLEEPLERVGHYQLGVEDILMWAAESNALFSLMADRERHYLGFEELERERHDEFVGRWRARPVTDPSEPLNLEFRWSVMPTRARSADDDAHTLRYRGEHLSLHMICNSSATYSHATRRCETHPPEEEDEKHRHQMSRELALFVALVMLMFMLFLIAFGLCV